MNALFPAAAIFLSSLSTAALADAAADAAVVPIANQKSLPLTIAGKPFAEYVYQGFPKPIVFPILGPGGVSMTRQWPARPAAPDEKTDHPHHQGLWFNHGAVNGIDFWAISAKSGAISVEGIPVVTEKDGQSTVKSNELWKDHDGKLVCKSNTVIVCGADGADKFLDYTITISATEGDVTFGDTKEGTMAMRSRPELNLKGTGAKGQAVNSEGQTGADIWAKHAKWVDYWGLVEGKVIGIACFDHPSNLRHPTTWHARDYGLIAANPFGLHDFEKKPEGAGDHTVKKGGSITFKYRWLFHVGDVKEAKIADRWEKWAKG